MVEKKSENRKDLKREKKLKSIEKHNSGTDRRDHIIFDATVTLFHSIVSCFYYICQKNYKVHVIGCTLSQFFNMPNNIDIPSKSFDCYSYGMIQ